MEQLPFIIDAAILVTLGVVVYAQIKTNDAWKKLLEKHREWSNHEVNVLRGRVKHLETDVYVLLDKLQKQRAEKQTKNEAQVKQPTISRKPRKVKQ